MSKDKKWSIEEDVKGQYTEEEQSFMWDENSVDDSPVMDESSDPVDQVEWEKYEENDYVWDECIADKVLYADWVALTIFKNIDLTDERFAEFLEINVGDCVVGVDLAEWEHGIDMYQNWEDMSNEERIVIFFGQVDKEKFLHTGNPILWEFLEEELEVWRDFDSTTDPDQQASVVQKQFDIILDTFSDFYGGC